MARIHERPLIASRRHAAAWLAAVVVAACTSTTTDSVSGGDVAAVSVTPTTTTVSIGAQTPLQALVQDATGRTIAGVDVHWSVQDPSIASISSNGVVTGIALGSTQVAASAGGKSGIGTITVEKTPVASVVVRPSHVDAAPGDHAQLTAIAYDAAQNPLSGRSITWSTSNGNVATVDANGLVTAVGPGNATITGTSEGKSDAATITVSQAPVATVTVAPNPLSMSVGQSTQLVATLKDASGNTLNGRTVTWSSSATAVATVNAQGVLTAVAQGTTTITATSEGKSGTAAVTISNVAVGSVTIQPQGASIVLGTNIQLSATVRDVNGNVVSDRVVTWSSSNTSVATVSSSGVATGVTPGSVTITATSEGQSGTTALSVTQTPVGSVTVSPSSASMRVGASATLTATVRDANGTVVTNRVVTWASSNTAVATVSSTGVVTGVAAGTVTITATSETKSGTASVTVTAIPVGSVTVSPATKTLYVTQTFALTATVKDSTGTIVTGRVVTWTSSAPLVASVSSTGVVTALLPGTATITATSEGKSGTSTITVALVSVSTVIVQPGQDSIPTNSSAQLTAITEDSVGGILTGRTVTWSTSDATIAAVNGSGLVTTASKTGAATITATSEGKSGTSAITVYAPVATVTVSPGSATILVTQTQAFTATLKDAQNHTLTGRTVTWSSNNTAVATINASTGVATGVAPGTVTITATSEGKTGTASLTVNPVPVATVTIQPPSPDTVYLGYTLQLTAITKDSAGGTLTGRTVTWSSGNTAIATVDANGLVTAVAAGVTTIKATSEGKNGQVNLVSMKAPVGSVVVSPKPDSVTPTGAANSVQLTATVRDVKGAIVTDRTVSWASTQVASATVSPSTGATTTVTGKAIGSTKVVATAETKADTAAVSVIAAVATVTVSPSSTVLSLAVNPTVQLSATCRDALNNTITGRMITWSSSNTAVATVDATGKVTAKTAGTATITATDAFDNKSATASVTVSP